MREKIVKYTKVIFAYGMSILLLICLITAICYLAAIVIGQPGSVAIHKFFSKHVLPIIYYSGIILSFLGMVNLYADGKLLFRLDIPKRKDK